MRATAWLSDHAQGPRTTMSHPARQNNLAGLGVFACDNRALRLAGSRSAPGWRKPVNLFAAVLLEPGNRALLIRRYFHVARSAHKLPGQVPDGWSGDPSTFDTHGWDSSLGEPRANAPSREPSGNGLRIRCPPIATTQ